MKLQPTIVRHVALPFAILTYDSENGCKTDCQSWVEGDCSGGCGGDEMGAGTCWSDALVGGVC